MGGIGSGRKKLPKRLFKDAIQNIDDSEIIDSLMTWARGKEVVCPSCGKATGAYTADTVALQAAIELLNRKRGKVPQQVQLDVTENVQITGDQADLWIAEHLFGLLRLIAEKYRIDLRPMLPEGVIEGEYKEV